MTPDNIIVQVRQRSEWEAVDLGFRLIQQVWQHILPAWLLFILMISALMLLLIPGDYLWVAGVLLWWFKPLYDRLILHIISRCLFAEQLSTAEVFSALPALIRHTGLFSALTWRRFSFSRSYNLPIWQLEQLRGTARKERQELLYLQGHSHAIGLTITCRLLELIIIFSIYALILLFDPTGQAWEHLKGLFTGTSGSDIEYWLTLGDYLTQVIAVLIIEPLFVAAGFALYLNRRTQLEAWDIELLFRGMGKRLEQLSHKHEQNDNNDGDNGYGNSVTKNALHTLAMATVTGCLTLLMLQPLNTVQADSHTGDTGTAEMEAAPEPVDTDYLNPQRQPVTHTATALEQVMRTEELSDRRQVSTWVPRNKNKPEDSFKLDEGLIQLLSSVFRLLLWAVVIVLLVLAVVYRKRILAMLKPPSRRTSVEQAPDVLFGMDIRPESLPDDIAGHARQLWAQAEHRAALSLLYRGTLMQLTRHDALSIADGHTEGDILALAKPALTGERFNYLQDLTQSWRSIAYAQRAPTEQTATQLFDGWLMFQKPAPTAQPDDAAVNSAGQPA